MEIMDFTLEIAKTIKNNRKIAGLSRIALADLAGVGKTAVYDIENGKKTVRLNTILAILDVLNIKLAIESPVEVEDANG